MLCRLYLYTATVENTLKFQTKPEATREVQIKDLKPGRSERCVWLNCDRGAIRQATKQERQHQLSGERERDGEEKRKRGKKRKIWEMQIIWSA